MYDASEDCMEFKRTELQSIAALVGAKWQHNDTKSMLIDAINLAISIPTSDDLLEYLGGALDMIDRLRKDGNPAYSVNRLNRAYRELERMRHFLSV